MPPQSTLQTPPQAPSQAFTSPRRTPTTTTPNQAPGQASRFHPYPLHPHPTFAYKPLTYRQPPASVSSTSSFAPSVASSSATARARPHAPQPGRSHSWSAPGDRVVGGTSAGAGVDDETVPPSALIWEEFCLQKEPGDELSAGEDYAGGGGAEWRSGVDGEPDDQEAGLPPLDAAVSNAANDAALAEFFSIFSHASVADLLTCAGAGSSVVVPLSAATADGNFPGAEFLDIPDSATSADASMMPDLGDIDFSQFGFGLFDNYSAASASAPEGEDGAGASASGSSTSQVSPPEHSSSTSGATPLSLSFGTPIGSSPVVAGLAHARDNKLHNHADDKVSHPEKHAGDLGGLGGAAPAVRPTEEAGAKKDINGAACSGSTPLMGSSPPCPTLPRTSQVQTPASLHSHPERTSNPTPGPTPTPAAVAAPPASQLHPPTPQQPRPATSTAAAAGTTGETPATQDKPARYPHLKRIRMTTREKEVLYFQKEVLNVVTAFYVDIASLFEKTPSDVIKRGMTRPGMGPDGESLEGVVNDIKDLVARLTVKASALPESPPPPRRVALPPAPALAPAPAHAQAQAQAHRRVVSTGSSAAEAIYLTAPTPSRAASSSSERSPTPLVRSSPAMGPAGVLPRAGPAVGGALGVSGVRGVRGSLAPPAEVVLQAGRSRKRKGTSDVPSPPRSPAPTTSPFAPPRQPTASTSTAPAPSTFKAASARTRTPTALAPAPAILARLPSPSVLPQPAKILHGPWTPAEVERLKGLVALSAGTEDRAPKDHVDWTWVVEQFGSTRNRHQVLIKAVELGLRETSTHYSRRVKQKGYRESREGQEQDKVHRSSSRGPPPATPAAQAASRGLLPSPMARGPASSGASAGGVTDTGTGRSIGERGSANKRARTGAPAGLVLRVGESSGSGSGSGAGRRDSEDSAPSDALHTPRGAMTPYAQGLGQGHGAFASPHHKTPYENVHSHAQAHAAHAHAAPRGQGQGHSRSHSLAELFSPRTPHTPHTPRTPHTPTLPQAGSTTLSPTHPVPTPLGFGAYAYLPPPPHYISPETTRARRERERDRAEAAERERRRMEVPAAPASGALVSPVRREFAGAEAGRRQSEMPAGPSRRGEEAQRPGLGAGRGSSGRGGLSEKRASV
ncbi:hypothetical protein IAT38_001381 [Cryptococcus sp. DSM 104549]